MDLIGRLEMLVYETELSNITCTPSVGLVSAIADYFRHLGVDNLEKIESYSIRIALWINQLYVTRYGLLEENFTKEELASISSIMF